MATGFCAAAAAACDARVPRSSSPLVLLLLSLCFGFSLALRLRFLLPLGFGGEPLRFSSFFIRRVLLQGGCASSSSFSCPRALLSALLLFSALFFGEPLLFFLLLCRCSAAFALFCETPRFLFLPFPLLPFFFLASSFLSPFLLLPFPSLRAPSSRPVPVPRQHAVPVPAPPRDEALRAALPPRQPSAWIVRDSSSSSQAPGETSPAPDSIGATTPERPDAGPPRIGHARLHCPLCPALEIALPPPFLERRKRFRLDA